MTGDAKGPKVVQPALSSAEYHRHDVIGMPEFPRRWPGVAASAGHITMPSNGVPATAWTTALVRNNGSFSDIHACLARLYNPPASAPHSAHWPPSRVDRHLRTYDPCDLILCSCTQPFEQNVLILLGVSCWQKRQSGNPLGPVSIVVRSTNPAC